MVQTTTTTTIINSSLKMQETIELDNHVHSRNKAPMQAIQSLPASHSIAVETLSSNPLVQETSGLSTTFSIPSSEEKSYPDGGWKAYSVTLGSFLGLIVNLGLINSIGALQTYISRNQLKALLEVNISWIFGVFLSIAYAGGLVTGPIFDKYGPLWLLVASSAFIFLGLMGAANSFEIWHFILSFISMGIGNGLGMTPLVGVISHWFDKRRGVTTAFATCGGSVGGLIFPLMLRSLYVRVGYVWAVRVLAFVCLGCMIASILLVKERFRKERLNGNSATNESGDDTFIDPEGKTRHQIIVQTLKDVFTKQDAKYIYVILGSFFAELSVVLLVTYFASYAIAQGMTESTSYLLLTVWNAVGILGRLVPGHISDIYGRFNINVLMLICFTLTILVLLLPFGHMSHGVIWAFAVLGGYSSGSVLSLLPACLSQITPVNEIGKKYGILNSLLALANLFGVPIAAAVIKDGTQKQYNNYIILVGVLQFLGTFFWYCSRVEIAGFRLNVKV